MVVCSSITALSQPWTHKICEEHAASCSAGWLTKFLGQSHSQDAHPELHSIIFDMNVLWLGLEYIVFNLGLGFSCHVETATVAFCCVA